MLCASPRLAREGELFYRGEKEVGGGYSKQRLHGFSLAEPLPGMKRSVSSSCWALGVGAPPSGLSTLVN